MRGAKRLSSAPGEKGAKLWLYQEAIAGLEMKWEGMERKLAAGVGEGGARKERKRAREKEGSRKESLAWKVLQAGGGHFFRRRLAFRGRPESGGG